jgi:hypothetical protein
MTVEKLVGKWVEKTLWVEMKLLGSTMVEKLE